MHTILEKLIIGNKYTLFSFNSMGFPASGQITLKGKELSKVTTYSEELCLKLLFVPKRKRKLYSYTLRKNETFCIWEGFENPRTNMYVTNEEVKDATIQTSLMGFDESYLDMALESVKNQPLVINRKGN